MGVKVRYRAKKENRQSVYLDIVKDGKRACHSLGLFRYTKPKTLLEKFHNKQIAEQVKVIVAERELELLTSKYDFLKVKNAASDFMLTFKQEADEHYKRRGAKSNTYCCHKHLQKFTGGSLLYKDLNENFVESFRDYLLSKLSANCARTYFLRFKKAVVKAHRQGIIQIDPTYDVKVIKEVQQPRVFLTSEEVHAMQVNPCNDNLIYRMFLFACFTGLRISDLMQVRWGQVDGNRLVYNPYKTKAKVHTIYLSDNAKRYMGSVGNPEERIFKWRFCGNRYDVLREWARKCGIIKCVTWHTARHTFATHLLKSTGNIKLVQEALGHARTETTAIYAQVLNESLEEAFNKLSFD